MQLEGFEQAAIELKAEIDALIAKYEKRLKTRIRAAYSPDWDAYVWVWSAGLHKALLGKDDEHIKVVRMTPV